MPTTHQIQQGENLLAIAKQHGFRTIKAIYHHPANAAFRERHPNPDILTPGEALTIPDKRKKWVSATPGIVNVYIIERPEERLRLAIRTDEGEIPKAKRARLTVGNETQDLTLTSHGEMLLKITDNPARTAQLEVFMDEESDVPTHCFQLQIGHLDPVETISGVQARCNLLTHYCGAVDNIMGPKTEAGIKSFQECQGLVVDGIAGPTTQAELIDIYGC